MPQIDTRLCIGCGACEFMCPADVYRIGKAEKAYMAYPEDCIGLCWLCVQRCPVDAISWKDHTEKRKREFSPAFAWEQRKLAWGIPTNKDT